MASRFYLINEKNVRRGMNTPSEGVFTEPKGFGMEYDSSYLKVGDVWKLDSRELEQPEPSGKLIFPVNPYNVFQDFIKFINSAKQLILVYQPAGVDTEYFAEIDIVSIDKGGYNRKKNFEVSAKFVCKSLFYTEEEFEYRITRAEREVRFNFRWHTKFNNLSRVYYQFDNTGHVESPFVLSFGGHCTNPVAEFYQDGILVHRLPFNLTLLADERLTISTFDDDLYVEVNGVDRQEVLDFTNDNFFKVPIGVTDIYFSCETGRINNIVMRFEKFYKAV